MFEGNNLITVVNSFNACTRTGQLSCGCALLNGEVISLCPKHNLDYIMLAIGAKIHQEISKSL
jgi:hypothetical protein